MVSSDGLAHDPALPARALLLDPQAAPGLLSSALGVPASSVASATIVRVNYQVGRSMRVVYRAEIDGATHTIAARMFAGAKSTDVYRRCVEETKAVGSLRGIGLDVDAGAVFWVFPNDRKITALEAVMSPATRVPGTSATAATSKRLVAYAPEKSATLACETSDGTAVAYAKVTAAHQAERDYRTYSTLRATLDPHSSTLTLPAPLAYSPDERTLWLQAVHGRRMAESTDDDEVEDLERLGAAVATFHQLAAPHAPHFERFSPAHIIENATIVCSIRPDVADAAVHLVDRLIAAAVIDHDISCLHGDLHPKNAIVAGDRVALIDVEDVTRGPAAADVASLLASLVYRRETGRLSARDCHERVAAFLIGYARRHALPPATSLAWHTAAALFVERAARAVTRLRPLGLQHLPALFAAAESLLDRGLEAL
jgi:tRNA A-37 threonylcarbamoyl transferase component Bud32